MICLLATPQMSDQTIWVIVGVGGMIGLYLLMRPRGKKGDPLGRVPKFPLARQRSVEQQMTNLLVELSEMARQITAQLDTRAAKLELLIKEADEKLAALRGAIGAAADNQPPARREIDSASVSPPPTSRPTTQPSTDDIPTPPPDHRHAEVYALADAGRPAIEIARLLQRPAGEIELILALRAR